MPTAGKYNTKRHSIIKDTKCPFGMLERSYSDSIYRFGFGGHEKDNEVKGEGNHLAFGDYGYDTRLARRWNRDPVVKDWESSYTTFADNPIWFVDPMGLDTVDVTLKDDGKWEIVKTQIAKGDDVFRLKVGEETYTYTFNEGEYGKRMAYLRLEALDDPNNKKKSYTLGVFHLSGTNISGFVLEPGGPATTKSNQNQRIPTGIYNLKFSNPKYSSGSTYKFSTKWPGYPLLYNENVGKNRGVRIHWSKATPRAWTTACLVVNTEYSIKKNCDIMYDFNKSKTTVQNIISYFYDDVDLECYSGADGYRNKKGSNRYYYPFYLNGRKTVENALIIKSLFND